MSETLVTHAVTQFRGVTVPLSMTVERLGLSARARNSLWMLASDIDSRAQPFFAKFERDPDRQRGDPLTLGELQRVTLFQMRLIPNCGNRTIGEIADAMERIGLEWPCEIGP